jgi:hypothetical protein
MSRYRQRLRLWLVYEPIRDRARSAMQQLEHGQA